MTTIASLIATLGLDASNYNSGMDAAEKKAGGLQGALNTFSGASLVAVSAGALAVGAGFASAVSVASSFEHQMSAVGAVAGASKNELAALSDKALQLGADTAFGATEAAGAMEILAGNGIVVADILGGAADAAVNLAAAGGTTLATAADTVSTAMAVWGLNAENTAVVVNMLAGAANVSRFGVEDMSLAIAQGGGAAATAGVSFEDFATSIAAIAPNFSSGADAGTSLKTMLTRLTPSTKSAKEAMYDLNLMGENGLPIWFDSQGNFKGMASVAEALHNQIGPLSDSQKTMALSTIFGSDAMRAAAAMSNMTAQEFTNMQNVMKNTDAAAVAAQRMDNFKGAMDQVGGSIETIQIKLGMMLLPVLTAVALWFAGALPQAFDATATAIQNGWQAIEPLREAFLDLAAAVGSKILPKLQAFADWFTNNEQAMKAAGMAVGGVLAAGFIALGIAAGSAAIGVLVAMAPLLLLVGVIAAVSAGVYLLIANWDQIVAKFPIVGQAADLLRGAFEFLAEAAGKVLGFMMQHKDVLIVFGAALAVAVPIVYAIAAAQAAQATAATAAAVATNASLLPIIAIAAAIAVLAAGIYLLIKHWDDITAKFPILGTVVNTVKSALQSFGDWLSGTFGPMVTALPDEMANAWRGLADAATTSFNAVKTAITETWAVIGDTVMGALNLLMEHVRIWTGAFVDLFKIGLEVLGITFEAAFKIVVAILGTYFNVIKNVVQLFIDILQGDWEGAWENIKDIVSSVLDGIKTVVSTGLGALAEVIPLAGKAIGVVIEALWTAAKSLTEAGWNAIKASVSAGISGIAALVTHMDDAGKALMNALQAGAKAVWETVIGWIKELPGLAKDGIIGGAGALDTAGNKILSALWEGAKGVWSFVIGWVATLPGLAQAGIVAGAHLLKEAAITIFTALWNGLIEKIGEVFTWAGNVPSMLVNAIGDVSKLLVGIGKSIASSLLDGLVEGAKAVWDEVSGWGDKIKGLKGPIEEDRVMLEPEGEAIAYGLGVGLTTGFKDSVVPVLNSMGNQIVYKMKVYGLAAQDAFQDSFASGTGNAKAGMAATFLTNLIDSVKGMTGPMNASQIGSLFKQMQDALVLAPGISDSMHSELMTSLLQMQSEYAKNGNLPNAKLLMWLTALRDAYQGIAGNNPGGSNGGNQPPANVPVSILDLIESMKSSLQSNLSSGTAMTPAEIGNLLNSLRAVLAKSGLDPTAKSGFDSTLQNLIQNYIKTGDLPNASVISWLSEISTAIGKLPKPTDFPGPEDFVDYQSVMDIVLGNPNVLASMGGGGAYAGYINQILKMLFPLMNNNPWEDKDSIAMMRDTNFAFDMREYLKEMQQVVTELSDGDRDTIDAWQAVAGPLRSMLSVLDTGGWTDAEKLKIKPLIEAAFNDPALGALGAEKLAEIIERWFANIPEDVVDEVGDTGLAGIANVLATLIEDGFGLNDVLKIKQLFPDDSNIALILLDALAGSMPSTEDIEALLGAGFWEDLISAIFPTYNVEDTVDESTAGGDSAAASLHVHMDGYIKDTDELMRDLMVSAERAGMRLVPA